MSHNALPSDQLQVPLIEPVLDTGNREAVLRSLFPWDYQHIIDDGIADRFAYDPETGEDSLVHILAGNIVTLPGGGHVFCGFHHEPSAESVWPFVQMRNEDGSTTTVNATRVIPEPLSDLTPLQQEKYARTPGDPYIARRVVIGGLLKVITSIKKSTGEIKFVPQSSSMFPDDHDGLGIVKKILHAYDNAEGEGELKTSPVTGKVTIHTEGMAPLIDDKTQMKIKIITTAEPNKEDRKIVAAFPIPAEGRMGLTDEQYDQLLDGISTGAAGSLNNNGGVT